MTFLNPFVLLGLIAAAIPIIIHFLTRQKAKEISFSSLRFLKLLENQQIRRLRWKQILLLIIRTLIILLIVLAFARPTLKSKSFWGVGSQAHTAAVLIIDNSMSMSTERDGAMLYDAVKQLVFEMENIFSTGDEIYGIFATPGAPSVFDGPRYNFSTVKKIIQKTAVSQNQTDFIAAILKAKEILEQTSQVNKEIYLISDLQTSGWADTAKIVLPLIREMNGENMNLIVIPVRKKKINNLSIARVTVANQIIEKGKVLEISAAIKNSGSQPAKNRLLQVFLDGKRVGQVTVSLDAGEIKNVNVKIVPEKVGFSAGSILIEDDDLFADNKGYFTFETPEQVSVLFVAPHEKDVRFFRLALNPTPELASRIKIDYVPAERVSFNVVKDYDVIILADIKRVDGNLLTLLKRHLENKKGLILFPGSDMDLRQINDNLNRELSLPEFAGTEGKIGQRDFFISLGKFDASHPIFSGIFEDENKKFSSPLFNFFIKLQIKPEHNVVMRFSNGEPFLVESNFKGGKSLVFASTADPNWSDLYLKGIFVPLLHRAVMYLANTGRVSDAHLFVGEKITASIAKVDGLTDLEMEKPDGKRQKIVPTIDSGALKIQFANTDLAGIYRLYQKNNLLGNWAVNCDPNESDFSFISEKQLKKILGKVAVMNVKEVASLTEKIREVRYGRELWKLFVAAALFLLLVEMWLSRASGTSEQKLEGIVFERNV